MTKKKMSVKLFLMMTLAFSVFLTACPEADTTTDTGGTTCTGLPDMASTSLSGPTNVSAGSTYTYTITVDNAGTCGS
ncbi:MAG: hypothetical protein OEZ36_12855, partial [Spirochaetota bacterium]|nr:hypothetical protein [Spirochaetota bacterium]